METGSLRGRTQRFNSLVGQPPQLLPQPDPRFRTARTIIHVAVIATTARAASV